ncbi:MAG TPA: adenylyl-sulfate kinase [Bacteroidia bacterium]|nr:adenylyl-sulfate kinase [Bacteroidia bacterium]
MNLNVHHHTQSINVKQREQLNGHRSLCIWFTGLSGSGKSTLANAVMQKLHNQNIHTYLLDGDNTRLGLNKDLGFSDADRVENIRRVGEVCKLMTDAGLVVLSAFISPFQSDRELVRESIGSDKFVEVYVECSLETCEARDPKGLYKKVRAGEISKFTGIDSPYESPLNPKLTILTENNNLEDSVKQVIDYISPLLKLD